MSTPVRRVAFATSALMVALSVAVPLMDGSDSFAGPTVEAEHHGSACVLHDHTLCTQVGANLSLVVEVLPARRPPPAIPLPEPVTSRSYSGPPLAKTHPARAPPYQRA